MQGLTKDDLLLVEEAKKIAREFSKEVWRHQPLSSIGAAARMKNGEILSAPNLSHPDSGPCSLCAEQVLLGKAYSQKNRDLDTSVAYLHSAEEGESGVVSPCGPCREFLRLFENPLGFFEF